MQEKRKKKELKSNWNQQANKDHLKTTCGLRAEFKEFFGELSEYPYQLKSVKERQKILEVGCGWGRATIPLSNMGADSYGIDFSEEMLRLAKANSKHVSVNLIAASAESLPFRNAAFDNVHSWFVLQHLPIPMVINTIQEIHRVLKPQGKVFVQFPNKFSIDYPFHIIWRLKRTILRQRLPPEHVRFYSLGEIRHLFENFQLLESLAMEYRPPLTLFYFLPPAILKALRKMSGKIENLANKRFPFLKEIIHTDFIVIARKPLRAHMQLAKTSSATP
jgi:2-polyprenyl-3-methyl-5-hydroxy-6-metoxy-1,4-benzoquinol methylase